MAKLTITVLVLTVVTVQAEFRSEGGPRRIPRSPSPEDPPPPVFHTHQWSGIQRSSDGKQAGVFSGAAAATDGGSHTSGQAFSLASATSGDNGAVLGTGSQVNVGQSGQSDKAASGENRQVHGTGTQVKVGHSAQPDKLESRFGGDDSLFDPNQGQFQSGYHGYQGHAGGGFGQAPYSQHKHNNLVKGGCYGGYESGSFAQSQAHSSAGSGYGGGYRGFVDPGRITFGGRSSASGTGYGGSQSLNEGFNSNANSRANAASNAFGNSGYGQSFGSGQSYDRLQSFDGQGAVRNAGASAGSNAIGQNFIPSQEFNPGQQGYNSGHQGYYSDHHGYDSEHHGYSKGHSALKGALDLASQGLQSQPNPGCSTCGKSNYALSNAKSHSGDAVAVSVGG